MVTPSSSGAASARNPWATLPSDWQNRIARRVQGIQWSYFKQDLQFANWCLTYYPKLAAGVDVTPARGKGTAAGAPTATRAVPPVHPQAHEAEVRLVFPIWWFNHKLEARQRNSLVCTIAKLEIEDLLDWVEDIRHVGMNCEILFKARRSHEAFHRYLLANGYGKWWFAHKSGHLWGVRSRYSGLQLHFRGVMEPDGSFVDGHIDSYNPGDPQTGEVTGAASELGGAIDHKILDDWHRKEVDDPAVVWWALSAQAQKKGPVVPWLA
jgi:hypothetical protein